MTCPVPWVMNAPTVGCLACGKKLEYAYTAMASTPWQVVAFENHTPQPVSLAEVTTVGEEKVLNAAFAASRSSSRNATCSSRSLRA